VKLVYRREQGGWGRRKVDSIVFYRDYLVRDQGAVRIDWGRLGLAPPEALVATGYGKNLLKAHFPTITEIRAHFLVHHGPGSLHAAGDGGSGHQGPLY
jgi:hypothetical protein